MYRAKVKETTPDICEKIKYLIDTQPPDDLKSNNETSIESELDTETVNISPYIDVIIGNYKTLHKNEDRFIDDDIARCEIERIIKEYVFVILNIIERVIVEVVSKYKSIRIYYLYDVDNTEAQTKYLIYDTENKSMIKFFGDNGKISRVLIKRYVDIKFTPIFDEYRTYIKRYLTDLPEADYQIIGYKDCIEIKPKLMKCSYS